MNHRTLKYQLKRKLIINQGGKCYVCRTTGADTIDHVIPKFILRLKGIDTSWEENQKLCCESCNNKMSVLQHSVYELLRPNQSDKNIAMKHARLVISFFNSGFGRLVLHSKINNKRFNKC